MLTMFRPGDRLLNNRAGFVIGFQNVDEEIQESCSVGEYQPHEDGVFYLKPDESSSYWLPSDIGLNSRWLRCKWPGHPVVPKHKRSSSPWAPCCCPRTNWAICVPIGDDILWLSIWVLASEWYMLAIRTEIWRFEYELALPQVFRLASCTWFCHLLGGN